MLKVQRRHYAPCKRKQWDMRMNCSCPLWILGTLRGLPKRVQKPASKYLPPSGCENVDLVTALARYWEMVGEPVVFPAATSRIPGILLHDGDKQTVQQAVHEFLADCRARELGPETQKKYRVLTDQLVRFSAQNGVVNIGSFEDVSLCRQFRSSWLDKNVSAQKKLERFRTVLQFCVDSKWLKENAAKKLKNPNTSDVFTPPFTDDEMERILAAVTQLETSPITRQRIEAMTLFMVYSGLRISDTCLSGPWRLDPASGKLFVRRQKKTGQPVTTFVPPFVVAKLGALPLINGKYWFFYTGQGSIQTAAGNARRTFRKLFALAGVEDGHPHRFRDTFAVNLLNADTRIEQVSILLGHKSVRITEQHYAPFVKSRAEHLFNAVERSWSTNTPGWASQYTPCGN